MAYTAQKLISTAWYISGIVSRGLETVSSEQLADGLERLNAILGMATSQMGLLPYYQEYDFTAVVGQETYYVPGLVSIETLTFNIGPVRYSILEASREQYFATGRVDNILSLPYQWHMERRFDGGDLFIYFLPQEAYPMKLWGNFQLENVDYNTDMSLIYQEFYLEYLRYKLAQYLCQYYNVVFPVQHENTLKGYEEAIGNVSPIDLTMQKLSCFSSGAPFNYGDVNIGRGWRPPS